MRLPRTRILEREEQLAGMAALARRARAGAGSAVIVEGPAGIGKTRFLGALEARARTLGMTVLVARGSEPEREFAFGVVRQLFEERIHAASPAQRRALLAGAARSVAPLLGARADGPQPQAQEGFAVVHGLYWLCANLGAHEPLVLVLDDAQWADEPSLRWLHFLCGRVEELPVLTVVATRTDEPRMQSPLLAEILMDDRHQRVPLPALSEAAVTTLVRERLGDDADPVFCAACHTTSGGNPFYLVELLGALEAQHVRPEAAAEALVREEAPESIGDAVIHRLVRLSSDAPSLARALAVLGPGAELQVAGHLVGQDRETAARAADALAAMQILEASGRLDFVHPIVRSAIYAEIPHWERARLHRRAAALLDGVGRLEEVAGQLLATEPAGEARTVEVLRDAAREAMGRGAPEVAVPYLRRALAEPPPPEDRPAVLRELGLAAYLTGDGRGREYLRSALALAGDPAQQAAIGLELGQALVVADQLDEAIEVLQTGLDESTIDRELSMALDAQLMSAAMMWPPSVRLGRTHLDRWRHTDPPNSPAGRLVLANLAFWGMTGGLHATRVRALAERALGGGRLLAERTGGLQFFYLAANALYLADWLDLGRGWLDKAVDQGRDLGSLVGFAMASCWRSDAAYRAGRLADAEADAVAALRAAGAQEGWGPSPAVLARLLQVLIERGELASAAALLRDNPIDVEDADTALRTELRYQRGRLLLAQGRLDEGLRDVLVTGDWERRAEWRNPSLWRWRSEAALGLSQLGRDDEARALASEEVALARPLGQPRTLGMALRVAGLVERGERGVELLQEAVVVLANGPSPLEHARALVSLGSIHRRRGHVTDARRDLREGLDGAHRCGAAVLVGAAQEELRLAGARPRRLRTTGLMALTAAERHVAQMAAEGRSNAEIGQAQFIGLKTVETHLSRVYSKLGVTSRTGLPAALARPRDE